MGDWISVWSNALALNERVSEIPLDFNRPEISDLATAASLSNERHHGAVRIYLGPSADRARVSMIDLGDTVQVIIPQRVQPGLAATQVQAAAEAGSGEPAETAPAPAANADEAQPTEAALDSAAASADAAATSEQAPAVTAPEPEPAPADAISTPPVDFTSDAGREQANGSFYLPRQSEAATAATEPDTSADSVTEAAPAEADPLPEKAEVNYQRLLSDEGSAGSGSETPTENEGGAPGLDQSTMQDIMRQAMQMTGEMLQQAATPAAPAPGKPAAGTISTPAASFYDPYKQQAAVSFGEAPEGAPATGKDALSDIRIELFEILGTPLDQALTLLVAPTKYNIIVDSSVGANVVSLSFKDSQTDLKSALDLLTKAYGLEYVVEAGTIVVAAKNTINGSLVAYESRLFVLSYADPTSIKDMLVATGQLNKEQIEVYSGEKEYPAVDDSTQLSAESEVGTQNVKPIQTNLSSTPRNALLVKAVPAQMDQIAELIAKLDRQPKIIDLEVRVCEAQETALRDLGISVQNYDTATPVPVSVTWTEQPAVAGGTGNEAFSVGSFVRSPLQFISTLNAQIQDGKIDVLAQPTLNTIEGKQAIYFAGEKVPYIARVTQTQTGGTQIETDFLNVGITLNFKPRLDADGKITIDVNPIVSSLIEFRILGDLVEAPRTSTRQLATTVRVGDCEPFVLAGLISSSERETMTKVPLLGDMPLIGKLFRNKTKTGARTEIIIVVTPHIHQ